MQLLVIRCPLVKSVCFLAATASLLALLVLGVLRIVHQGQDSEHQGQDSAESVASLIPLLRSTGRAEFEGFERLRRLEGKARQQAVTELSVIAHDPDPEVRLAAGRALVELHAEPGLVMPVFLELMRSPDKSIRGRASFGIGGFGSEARGFVHDLEVLAKGETIQEIRIWNLVAILNISPGNENGMAGCAELLGSKDSWIVNLATGSLGQCGALASPYVPVLLKTLKHSHVAVRTAAANALGLIGDRSTEVIKALSEAVKDEDAIVAVFALQALGDWGSAAESALSAIRSATESKNRRIRDSAWQALREIEKDLEKRKQ